MSEVKGRVGPWELRWESAPHGNEGVARVRVGDRSAALEVRWRRDGDGIWIELPGGAHGFDISGERDDDGAMSYRVSRRIGAGEWTGVSFARGQAGDVVAVKPGKKTLRVRAQMPGKIVRVLVKEGDEVAKDQPILVMEAMKMENEIRAPLAARVKSLKATEGQAVESGVELAVLE